jgi:hypothetical protein
MRHGNRTRAAFAVIVALVTGVAISACEVSQINWSNRTYTVSGSCVRLGTVTLHDGVGVTRDGVLIKLLKVHRGDINGDGITDAAVYLACASVDPQTGIRKVGDEIQIFSRNAKPLARLTPPVYYGAPLGAFNPNDMKITNGRLYTGTYYADNVYAIFGWKWNGHGFDGYYVGGHHN